MVGFWPIDPLPGTFENRDVADGELGRTVLETKLVRTSPAPAEIAGEYEFLELKKPIPFDPFGVEDVTLLMRGNGGFGRVYVTVADENAIRAKATRPGFAYNRHSPLMGVGHRGYVSFTGWTLAEVDFDLGKFGRSRLKDGTCLPLYIVGLMIEDCRKALDPVEMREVKDALRFAGVYVKPKAGAAPKAKKGRNDAAGVDEMKHVDDKDL